MSGAKIAMAQPHSFQSGALSFMSCASGRESSPTDENDCLPATEFKTETKKKRFHPLRNLRRMFRRKTRRSSISADSYQGGVPDNPETGSTNLEQRSCSTSRLQEENSTQNLIRNSRLNPGLSLSHDSIFTPDRADSGLSSSDLENSSLSITVLTPPSKECPTKSQSSCSETSLLSIGSSEVESSPVRGGKSSDLDLGVTAYKLSHSAAKHKMSVKPRRNHGVPRSKRRTMTSKSPLPSTPEVSEEGATGKSSPQVGSSVVEIFTSEPFSYYVKRISQAAASGTRDPGEKSTGVAKLEDETDAKDEESGHQKTESFFGRFLSRRSEKKKKVASQETGCQSQEDAGQKKSSRTNDGKVGPCKTPNRRQRVEPIDIPSARSTVPKYYGNEREESTGRNTSSSVSPPKTHHRPSEASSRSISPPKVVWPENFIHVKREHETFSWEKTEKEQADLSPTENLIKDLKNSIFFKELTDSVSLFAKDESGKRKKMNETESEKEDEHNSETEPIAMKSTSAANILEMKKKSESSSESAVSPKRDDTENGRLDFATTYDVQLDYETVKNYTSHPVRYDPVHDGYENIQIIELVKKETRDSLEGNSAKSDRTEIENPAEDETVCLEPEVIVREFVLESEILESKLEEEPEVLTIEVKELETLKIEIKDSDNKKPRTQTRSDMPKQIEIEPEIKPIGKVEEKPVIAESIERKTESVKILEREPEIALRKHEKGQEVVRRVKPMVSEKPRDLKKVETPEFAKVSFNRLIEGRNMDEATEIIPEKVPSKAGATLVERRKSELMLLTETEEKDGKGKIKSLKKQTSFSETAAEKQNRENFPKSGSREEENSPGKTDGGASTSEEAAPQEEVVLRKKSAVYESSDEQPELMKVFARRSLKIRESEKIPEDVQKSRDSDKENEMADSPKEDRKKQNIFETEDGKEPENRVPINKGKKISEVKVNITPLKPEVVSRKCVVQKYGRSLSENNGKSKEEASESRRETFILEENKMNKMRNITEITVGYSVAKDERNEEREEETGFKRIQQRKAEWERRAQQGAK